MEAPRLTCFSDEAHDASFHFQILCLDKQLYIWIGCNSARLGHLFASIPTPYDKMPSLSALIGGGGANSAGGGIARRLALRTGYSVVLAANLPSNAPSLEGFAERRVLKELQDLGYTR
ncbi:proteasome assembly chaperone 4-like [Selaginella moellendorffii]|uniref:proteasome assembly chaperone 4-like n=1 Tax=Selaginella moellendorffii TaxID=88036 RepID=UPI000D1CF3A4|nr:proteasome assembly chaperone 4-like [Selaginella moellendorffii]|eukprot:XP_024545797.1 proteasome assembly chaperone 4-like [Selaginella moellendorffii]